MITRLEAFFPMAETLVPALIACAIVVMLYRRIRRLFVRQKVSLPRFALRIGLPGVVALLLLLHPGSSVNIRALGVALGLVLALGNVLKTKMEFVDQEWFFHPDPVFGNVVMALLVGRLAYRFFATQDLTAASVGDPTGRLLVLTVATYFSAYHVGILGRRSIQGGEQRAPEEENREQQGGQEVDGNKN